ncbi:MAG: glycoside hydrolase family 78 protein [Planctomycetaceae bacterium]|jgi:alpha-L-rhamnosidase|nr:glycoside hydrolase family 78 protein [Planctomycetaceae bacterium]
MLKRLSTICFVFLFILPAVCVAQENKPKTPTPVVFDGVVKPYQLRLEFLSEPRGIDELKPRFSWKLKSNENDQTQSAYQIIVYRAERIPTYPPPIERTIYRTEKNDFEPVEIVWDSGKVTENTVLVEYAGKPLLPKSEYVWVLTVWDKQDKRSEITAMFSTGIFEPEQWQAKWIGLDAVSLEEKENEKSKLSLDGTAWIWTTDNDLHDNTLNVSPGHAMFRKIFDLAEPPEIGKAELALAADNEFTAYLNGKEVGNGSNFKTAKLFDVTGFLKQGKNVLAVDVANHGDSPNPAGLIGVLRIQYKNGTELLLRTDTTWKAVDGLPEGSKTAEFDDSVWKNVVKIADLDGGPWGEVSINTSRPSPPERFFVKNFTIKEKPVRATAYISGLGYYTLNVNGKQVGDHVLDPVLTDYDKRVPYVTYDIDPAELKYDDTPNPVNPRSNYVVARLGNGRFYAPRLTEPTTTRTFGYPKLLFQLEIQYADGSTETIVSDENWLLSTNGPVRDNNDYDGEIYDARKNTLPFRLFGKAQIVDAPKGKLVAQMMPPMRVVEKIAPVSVKEVKPGVWIFDFGVNLVGNCQLQAPAGLAEGTELKIRHAETLLPDGTLYVANLRGAQCRDIYIASGKENDGGSYAPFFTYHGFRYAELTGLPENVQPTEKTLTARVINTDLPKAGKFETSNATINAIFRNVVRGTQGNYLSIPTDCPQRDERQGWQGDRAAESKGEMFLFDNTTLYSKWLIDIEDSQRDDGNLSDVCPNFWPLYGSNVTWPSAFTIIPDSIYTMYGDRRPIEKHYEAMKRWLIGHLGQFVNNGIIEKDNYGDWCVPPEKPELIHSQDPARNTSKAILATSYYIHNLDLLTKYAKMLGKNSEAEEFVRKATEMRKAFNDKFLNTETAKYDNGTQTSCVLPLRFGIVPPELQSKVFETLVANIEKVTDNHIGTGLIGGQWLNRVLSDFGRADISYKFTTNTDYPSWGYMVAKGATTIWELWNGDTANPAMNSGNHVMLVGDLVIWYYEYLAGIKADPEHPGFEHIIMKPFPVGDLDYVNAEYDSVRGLIKSRWKRDGNKFHWEIEIPPGSTATVFVPNGKTLKNIPSGKHVFDSELGR